MQNLYNCIFFRHNENMNKTCAFKGIQKMCKIYHDEVCSEYKEKENEIDKSDSMLDVHNNCMDSNNMGDD